MTYIRRDQLTSHEVEGRVGCELVSTYITHIPWSRYMGSHLIRIVASDWLKLLIIG